MRTDDIANAFRAIVEEAEKIKGEDLPETVKQTASTIISIAKHQNDIRGSAKGSCKAHEKKQ
jgi:hypothetical protein